MFCVKCGSEIKEGTKFCVKCGTPVVESMKAAVTMSEPGSAPDIQQESTLPKHKKAGNNGLGIIALVILIIALLAAGAYLLFFSENGIGKELFAEQTEEREDEEDDSEDGEENGLKNGKSKKSDLQEEASEAAVEEAAEEEVYTGEKTDVSIEVRQVDNSNFPEITLYASITDQNGNAVEKLEGSDFEIQEIDENGKVTDATVDDVYQVLNKDNISVNLVLDSSDSMDSYEKMHQAKNAAKAFIDQMELSKGDQVEIISFDDFVYLEQEFTSQKELLTAAVDGIETKGMTALYDALYAGLFQTYYEDGVKCVIGFTDGLENASSYTFDDVVSMAQSTGIPVFIIGIGEEYDAYALQELAELCSGKYYSANVNDLETILEDIYVSIYQEQQDYYVVKYTTTNLDNPTEFRDTVIEMSDKAAYDGRCQKSYVPKTDISGAFSDSYMDLDFMLDFSSQREVTEADLEGLSLAELRIARNEIYARHGRQFKDSMLNQWFYSKEWYLNISPKYSPDDFDAINPGLLSSLELRNANFIREYENEIMNSRDIYPDADDELLSDYDLALSKAVLKTALNQMRTYSSTSVLEENIRLVEEAIDKEDVQY